MILKPPDPPAQTQLGMNCMKFVVDGLIPLGLPFAFHKDIDVFFKIAKRNGNICNSSQKTSFGSSIRLLITSDANMTRNPIE